MLWVSQLSNFAAPYGFWIYLIYLHYIQHSCNPLTFVCSCRSNQQRRSSWCGFSTPSHCCSSKRETDREGSKKTDPKGLTLIPSLAPCFRVHASWWAWIGGNIPRTMRSWERNVGDLFWRPGLLRFCSWPCLIWLSNFDTSNHVISWRPSYGPITNQGPL